VHACYVPGSGIICRIKEPGLKQKCSSPNHVEFSWTMGEQGSKGDPGPAGQACWDLNGNGERDLATEDVNHVCVVDVADCQGPPGPAGAIACRQPTDAALNNVPRSDIGTAGMETEPVGTLEPDGLDAEASLHGPAVGYRLALHTRVSAFQATEPFLGELVLWPINFAPRGWAYAEGQLLAISSNTALFSLLGTTYGGDGVTTFALPDMRGHEPVCGMHYIIALVGIYPSRN
jgi:hypothetical protein